MSGDTHQEFTDAERAAARRELVRMPTDLRRTVHEIAERRGLTTVDAVAAYMKNERGEYDDD